MSLLGDRLREHARDHGDEQAVHAREQWWSYRDLATRAAELAAALSLGPGDAVVVAIYSGIEAVVAICAAALVDAIPVVIDPRDREQADRTITELCPACVVTSSDSRLPGARVIDIDRDRPPRVGAAEALAWTPKPRPVAISHILFTSGSTARAKGIIWSQLRAGHDWEITQPTELQRERPSGIVAPLCTGLGLHELLRSLFHRLAVAVIDMPFLPAIAEIQALGINRLKLTPTHVEILLATASVLADVRRISITSAPITPERVRALVDRAPAAKIGRAYGLNECGSATMIWLDVNPGKLKTVGRPIHSRRVTVRDSSGAVLPPGQTGEVVVEVPVWDPVDGYLDPTPELQRRFENGVLRTGDRGTFDERGFLMLGARLSEILKVGGRSVSAPRIEQSLRTVDGIAEVTVVGVRDRFLGEVPCAVFVPTADCDPSRLVGGAPLANTPTPDEEIPRWYLPRRALPRGPSGKIRRGLLAKEAKRWTHSFTTTVVPPDDARSYPAFDLENGVAVVDGLPQGWKRSAIAIDPYCRPITLVARRPARPLAFAAIRAGSKARVRFIVGPIAVELVTGEVTRELLDMFAGELLRLAPLLPGPAPSLTCVLSATDDRVFTAAGFARSTAHPAWLVRGEVQPIAEQDFAASIASHDVLVAWAGQRRSATSER